MPLEGVLGCGFATRLNEGSNKWKLIKGYGGGPDTWCNSTAGKGQSKAECAPNGPTTVAATATAAAAAAATTTTMDAGNGTCFTQAGLCLPYGDNSKTIDGSTLATCCAACVAEQGCQFWVHNAGKCYLKEGGNPPASKNYYCTHRYLVESRGSW